MKIFYKICLVYICLVLTGLPAGADVIRKPMGEEQGTFTEYSNSKFILKTDKGKSVEVPKASVRELILDEPVKVTLLRKGKSGRESAELLGYDKLQFKLKQKNRKISLSAMYITSLKAQRPVSGGGMGGGAVGSGDTAIPAIDTSEFDESVMTESQKSALATYNTVRRRYDAFLTESSAMVAEMDRAGGQRREELLSKLRIRKNQEQPVRLEMSAAHKALLAAFPEGFPLKPKVGPAAPEEKMPPPGESASEVIEKTVDADNEEVLLIDTSPIAESGNLTEIQMKALDAYDKAAAAFQQISQRQASLAVSIQSAAASDKANLIPLFEQGKKEVSEARAKLLETQKAFLKAFPQLRLTE